MRIYARIVVCVVECVLYIRQSIQIKKIQIVLWRWQMMNYERERAPQALFSPYWLKKYYAAEELFVEPRFVLTGRLLISLLKIRKDWNG